MQQPGRCWKLLTQLNNDDDIHGILVQLPLPKYVDSERVIAAVRPDKDVDGFNPFNLGLLFPGTTPVCSLHPKRYHDPAGRIQN